MRFPVFAKGRSALLRYKESEEGTAIVLLGFTIFVLVGAAGLAFDAGRGYMLNARLSQAVDAAALAGGRSLSKSGDKTYQDIIKKYFKANLPDGYMGADIPEPTIELLEGGDEIEVTATATVPTTLMRVLGSENMQISARAVVHRQVKGLEVALVLDNSGSMDKKSKMTDLKSAVKKDLLPILYGGTETNTVENLYLSIVPFTGRTNLKGQVEVYPDSPAPKNANYVCLDIRPGEYAENDAPPKKENFKHFSQGPNTAKNDFKEYKNRVCPKAAITPLVQTRKTIEDAVTAMKPDGCTRYDIGAVWGWRTLSPEWQGVWENSDSNLPLEYGVKDMQKAIIIMTDGKNTPDCVADVPLKEMSKEDQRKASEAAFARICADMKASGIVIYTVTFRLDDKETNELFENCASGKDRYFRPKSGESLKADFVEIANDLSTLRLSQ